MCGEGRKEKKMIQKKQNQDEARRGEASGVGRGGSTRSKQIVVKNRQKNLGKGTRRVICSRWGSWSLSFDESFESLQTHSDSTQ